ncbi:hypothetical protein TcasGA2_TC011217 [Tribolium castaneum]|uniref:THAP-type domain-containing protein n=1 Tax=Tribolium castaneum TaxID=7070 RepID=D6X3N8_TRICA|nr:hypothetical protein TcasGA2_TC011217 [Tribolium castaneum]
MEERGQRAYACKFPLCNSVAYRKDRNKRFFKSPSDQGIQQLWKTICNIEPGVRCENFRICEDHFRVSDFRGSRTLCPFAVPKAVFNDRVNDEHSYCGTDEGISEVEIEDNVLPSCDLKVLECDVSEELPSLAKPDLAVNEQCQNFESVEEVLPVSNIITEDNQPSCSFAATEARGIRKRWKQPIAYYFTASTISAVALKQIIVKAVEKLKSLGLIVLATVCDQGATNRSAMTQLCSSVNDTPLGYHFEVDGSKINCIFDPVHLLKNTRNALIENFIEFAPGKRADFEHILMVFESDQKKKFRSLHKLSREDFNFKNSYTKMKVSVAARQLSYSVACELETYVSHNQLPPNAVHTAEFVHLIDQLFDSCNGTTKYSKRESKPLRCAIREDSPHINFWTDLLAKINNWKIINKATGKNVTNQFHFINGWKVTIRSIIAIWHDLQNLGLEYLCGRVLNQDTVENLFCCVRQHGIANTNPTCFQFMSALKTYVLNNLVMPRNSQSNCKDDGDSLLDNLMALLKEGVQDDSVSATDVVFEDESLEHQDFFTNVNVEDIQGLAYVSGYIVKKMAVPDCAPCKDALHSPDVTPAHTTIMFRDDGKRLVYAPESFINFVNGTNEPLCLFLKTCATKNFLEDQFKGYCMSKDTFQNFFTCSSHSAQMLDEFFKVSIPFLIFKYVNEINKGSQHAATRALKKHVSKIQKFTS